MIYPFAYNAVTKTLRVYTRLEIVMEKVSDNGVNAKTARKGNVISMDPEIKSAYSRRFINFEEATAAKYEFLDDAGEMLVVCADSYMEAMQPYVNWKNISGRPTTIVPTSEAGTTGEAVKSMSVQFMKRIQILLLYSSLENIMISDRIPCLEVVLTTI